MRFDGYKVLITGATSGIGLAAAKRFMDEGATVIGLGRNFSRTKELGDKFIPCVCDIKDVEQIKKAVQFTSDTFGGTLDTFVNAAGLNAAGTITDITPEQFDDGVSLLLRPAVVFGQALYPMLKNSSKGNGSIVNIGGCKKILCLWKVGFPDKN